MVIDRRHFIAGAALLPVAAQAATGIDGATLGLRSSDADQTATLQKAIDQAAAARQPLFLPPGTYRANGLNLPAGAQINGVRGATRLTLARPAPLLSTRGASHVTLTGLVLDGGGLVDGAARGVVQLTAASSLRINDCEFLRAGKSAIVLEQCDGEIARNTVDGAADTGIFSNDARGLIVSGNTIRRSGNNGICVWQSDKRDDGTQVVDNRIEDTQARAGGSGQNGNAINVYRAANVIVRGNRIRNAAFSAVRGNAASNIQMVGNTCTALGEVALYAEFGFEGAIIADNIVDGAAIGVAVTNFNNGGRLAVVRGNLIRNLVPKRPPGTDPNDGAGIGIGVEADTNVTGNVIENAPYAGITIGFMQYLRDVSVTANTIRNAGMGITVSVSRGAGAAVIANNLIAETRRGAILGMDGSTVATGDLMAEGAGRFPHLAVTGNRAR